MVREVRIYAEGGGNVNLSRNKFRTGLSHFLAPLGRLARARQIAWSVIPCGPRTVAFESFRTALRTHPDTFNVLLVDSEAPVTQSPWTHLQEREGWEISGSREERCHLMAHCMESWLVADPETLAAFYGQGFRLKSLPSTPDIETVSKEKIAAALRHATRETQKGTYHKIRHGPDLLGRLDPARVRRRAKHCDRLFVTLEALLRAGSPAG